MRPVVFALALILASVLALAQPPKVETLRVMGGGLPLRVARANGMLAKYGIEVQGSTMPNSDTMRSDLAAGRIDIAHANVDNAVAVVEATGANVVIVLGGSGSQDELIAQADNKSITDLRGKTLIVDAPNTALALELRKLLLGSGVKPGVDCELKPFAVTAQRLAAMRENKSYAASMLGPPSSIMARRAGLVGLASVSQAIGKLQGGGAFVRRDWAHDHAALLERYIAANIEAQRWIMDPANKDKVLNALMDDSKLPADVAAEAYEELLHAPGGWQKDLRFDVEGFINVLNLRADIEGTWGGKAPAPGKYFDLSYYDKALAMIQ